MFLGEKKSAAQCAGHDHRYERRNVSDVKKRYGQLVW